MLPPLSLGETCKARNELHLSVMISLETFADKLKL